MLKLTSTFIVSSCELMLINKTLLSTVTIKPFKYC